MCSCPACQAAPAPVVLAFWAEQERAAYHGHVNHTCLIDLARATLRALIAAGDQAGAAQTRASIKVLEAARSVHTRRARRASRWY